MKKRKKGKKRKSLFCYHTPLHAQQLNISSTFALIEKLVYDSNN